MLTIFANMFQTATRSDWDTPINWKLEEPRKTMAQQQREAEEWRRRALRDVGLL
mgnify:CR=1 FL=1